MWRTLTVVLTAAATATASAKCECGYTVNSTSGPHALFTDLFETDFLHIQSVAFNNSYDTGWEPQNYTTSSQEADGPYGMDRSPGNLVPNYIDNEWNYNGPGVKSIDPGLQLWVRSELLNPSQNVDAGQKPLVPSSEIVSQRDDILYGSFRIAMKTTEINGTCTAFFLYRNDTQEIDMEILSAQQHSDTNDWPIHLVVQNTSVGTKGDQDGSSQMVYQMAFPPGGFDYNEYRFDWLPGRIDYYINSWFAWSETENVPSTPGRIHISHWSNGNPYWSQGPPRIDAVSTVSYVKAYFNSTNSTREKQYHSHCSGSTPKILTETCQIPDQDRQPNPFGADGNDTGHTFFFSHHNMAVNQTLYDPKPLWSAARGRYSMMGVWVFAGFGIFLGVAL